jgi:hypothetical protein
MLMRAEANKFSDESIPKVESELLCGERHAVIQPCEGTAETGDTINGLITKQKNKGPLGDYTTFLVKATKSS